MTTASSQSITAAFRNSLLAVLALGASSAPALAGNNAPSREATVKPVAAPTFHSMGATPTRAQGQGNSFALHPINTNTTPFTRSMPSTPVASASKNATVYEVMDPSGRRYFVTNNKEVLDEEGQPVRGKTIIGWMRFNESGLNGSPANVIKKAGEINSGLHQIVVDKDGHFAGHAPMEADKPNHVAPHGLDTKGNHAQKSTPTTFTQAQIDSAVCAGSCGTNELSNLKVDVPTQVTLGIKDGVLGSSNNSGITRTATITRKANGTFTVDKGTATAINAVLKGNSTAIDSPRDKGFSVKSANLATYFANDNTGVGRIEAVPADGQAHSVSLTVANNKGGEQQVDALVKNNGDGTYNIQGTEATPSGTISRLTGLTNTVSYKGNDYQVGHSKGDVTQVMGAGWKSPQTVTTDASCTCQTVTGKTPEGHPYKIVYEHDKINQQKTTFDSHMTAEAKATATAQASTSVQVSTTGRTGQQAISFGGFSVNIENVQSGGFSTPYVIVPPAVGVVPPPLPPVTRVTPPPSGGYNIVGHGGGIVRQTVTVNPFVNCIPCTPQPTDCTFANPYGVAIDSIADSAAQSAQQASQQTALLAELVKLGKIGIGVIGAGFVALTAATLYRKPKPPVRGNSVGAAAVGAGFDGTAETFVTTPRNKIFSTDQVNHAIYDFAIGMGVSTGVKSLAAAGLMSSFGLAATLTTLPGIITLVGISALASGVRNVFVSSRRMNRAGVPQTFKAHLSSFAKGAAIGAAGGLVGAEIFDLASQVIPFHQIGDFFSQHFGHTAVAQQPVVAAPAVVADAAPAPVAATVQPVAVPHVVETTVDAVPPVAAHMDAAHLKVMLTDKFGSLPDAVQDQIRHASSPERMLAAAKEASFHLLNDNRSNLANIQAGKDLIKGAIEYAKDQGIAPTRSINLSMLMRDATKLKLAA